MNFSDWVLTESQRRGWSQATLAARAGLSLSTVRRVLVTGSRKPGMRFFTGIARAFELKVAEVVVIWEQAEKTEEKKTI